MKEIFVNRENWKWYVENKKRGLPGFFSYHYNDPLKSWIVVPAPTAKQAEKDAHFEETDEFRYVGFVSIRTFPAELVLQLQRKIPAVVDFYVSTSPVSLDLLEYVGQFPENEQ